MTNIEFIDALDAYWDEAYAQGRTGQTHDTMNGDAQRALDAVMATHEALLAEKQAEIDRLMLEFCPTEMTRDQMANWERSQTAANADQPGN